MFIEQPPWFFRALYPQAIFRMDPYQVSCIILLRTELIQTETEMLPHQTDIYP